MNKVQLLKNDLLKIEQDIELLNERDVIFTNEDQQIEIFMKSCANEIKLNSGRIELTADEFENNWNNIQLDELSDCLRRQVKSFFSREKEDTSFNFGFTPNFCLSFRKTGETNDDIEKTQSAIERAQNLLKNKRR